MRASRPSASADENPTNPRMPSTMPVATPCTGMSVNENCEGSHADLPAHTRASTSRTVMMVTEISSSTRETRADRRIPRMVNSVANPPSTIASTICQPAPWIGMPIRFRKSFIYDTAPPSEPAAIPQQPTSSVTPAR